MFLEKCALLVLLFHTAFGQSRVGPLVKTSVGVIKGLKAEDGDYLMFLGIPFAQVDADNPFGAAKPYPAFENTFEAYKPIRNAPIILAEYLGYSTKDMDKALKFLAKANSQLVMQSVKKLGLDDNFRPCIEKKFEGVESFITENWITANIPKIKNMQVLIGFNNDELHFAHTFEEDEFYKKRNTLKYYLPRGFDTSADDFKGMEEIVRHFYFGDEPMSTAVKRGVIDFESDFLMVHPTYRSISKYLDNEAGDIFFYLFSYVGERNYLKYFLNLTEATGAAHCDETGYIFDISYMKNDSINLNDQMKIDQTTTMIANFVKFGNPTPEVTELLPITWIPVTNKLETPCLNIDTELKLERRPFTQRVTFWDLFYKVNAHLQIVYPSAKVVLSDNDQPVNPKTEL
ncbi:unnamed protein product [Arctia plantaginis]|uniref:Carboxylesterase type B domain-containing protein n=1 Tax=Arctia plantaginis TaxID=874455 RepID=A0A8S0YNS1_ARCPL|nr:unnamed protein product [Arctia plantaginis]